MIFILIQIEFFTHLFVFCILFLLLGSGQSSLWLPASQFK